MDDRYGRLPPTPPDVRRLRHDEGVACRGEVLWAYNERHLDTLAAYMAAGIRERAAWPMMGMLDRLPAWIKAAGHREDVLKAIGRLRERAAS
jgi:hypothetical protein